MKNLPQGGDIVAGLSVAGLLLPEAVAYASIAALPPQHALFAGVAGLVCYAIFGGSRFAIVSPTSSSCDDPSQWQSLERGPSPLLRDFTKNLCIGRPFQWEGIGTHSGIWDRVAGPLGEPPDRDPLGIAAHWDGSEQKSLTDCISRGLTHGVGDDEF